jgi:hypothetical protein
MITQALLIKVDSKAIQYALSAIRDFMGMMSFMNIAGANMKDVASVNNFESERRSII